MRHTRFAFTRALYAALLAATLSACGSDNPPNLVDINTPPDNTGGGTPVAASAMDVTITSVAPNVNDGVDTTAVTATVFIPAHTTGSTYPLVIHSHGWGGSRVSAGDLDGLSTDNGYSSTSFFTLIDAQVKKLWDAGYAVISFDERGFGRTDDGDTGTADGAHVMSPDYEIKDAQAVIDWAVANLDLTLDGPGDPKLGAIGGSYGGGYQILLAAVDPRVDAIVPGATWFSLEQSLAPGAIIKKGYASGLCVLAQTDQAELAAETEQACQEGSFNQTTRFEEELSDPVLMAFRNHGLNFYAADPNFRMPKVDALLIQGNRDILFNLSQAEANRIVVSTGGGDVRLLSHQNGHSLRQTRMGPGSQGALGPNSCGQIDTLDAIKRWFDAKLKGQAGAISALPSVCIALDDLTGVNLETVPRGDAAHTVTIPDGTMVTAAQQNNTTSAAGQATFVPLADPIVGDDQVLAGIALANLRVGSPLPGTEGVVFVGLGILRGGSRILVDDQVQPIRSSDPRVADPPQPIGLVAVGEKLQDGDQVGVLIYADHDQFENEARTLYPSNAATISGTVMLPVITAAVQARTP